MQYVSTRGQVPPCTFEEAVMTGLAPDGGLYVPAHFPTLTAEQLRSFRGKPFAEVAAAVLAPFVAPSLSPDELRALTDKAWARFDAPDVTPLVQLGERRWLLELWHGPTLAFKDVALQLLGLLFDHFLARQGRHAMVLGATSGDTGSAAIAGCRGRDQLDIVILHPHGRTSDVQRRQMTTVPDANVHNVAVEGTFDDCQALVKTLFRDAGARERYGLCAVNSINTARVLAQVVYYVTAAVALGAPERPVSFCVPTGNFGDVLAGHWARRMGVPIPTLVVATNTNDILARTLATGRYTTDGVVPTLSPSMDIQVSSNFERLLYELAGDDAAAVRAHMQALSEDGGFTLSAAERAALARGFAAGRADDAETLACIARTASEAGRVVDPHTAVALSVAEERDDPEALVVLSTAHPAKFPDAVRRATGTAPPEVARLTAMASLPERYEVIPATEAAVRATMDRALALRAPLFAANTVPDA